MTMSAAGTPRHQRATSRASAASRRRQDQPSEQTNYFACSQCKETYHRADYLIRHVRTHTKERPYLCSTCGKSFGRQDLLKRHKSTHLNGRPSLSARNGIRVSQACKLCASKKSKCSESKPCLRCVAKGIVCEYEAGESDGLSETTDEPGTEPPRAVSADRFTEDAESPCELTDTFPSSFAPFVTADHPGPAVATSIPGMFGGGLQGAAGLLPQDTGPCPFDVEWGMDTVDFSALEQIEFGPLDMDIDYAIPTPHETPANPPRRTVSSVGSTGTVSTGPDVYKTLSAVRSWEPNSSDSDQADSRHLAIGHGVKFQESSNIRPMPQGAMFKQSLDGAPRDRILHMILRVMSPANMAHIMNGLPSADTLFNLVKRYVLKPRNACVDDILHFPTLQLDKQEPELLGAMIAMGSLRTESPEAHKFGHALQDVVRLSSFRRVSTFPCSVSISCRGTDAD